VKSYRRRPRSPWYLLESSRPALTRSRPAVVLQSATVNPLLCTAACMASCTPLTPNVWKVFKLQGLTPYNGTHRRAHESCSNRETGKVVTPARKPSGEKGRLYRKEGSKPTMDIYRLWETPMWSQNGQKLPQVPACSPEPPTGGSV
jgi:hypothetical protein